MDKNRNLLRSPAVAYLLLGNTLYFAAVITTFGTSIWQHTRLGPTLGPTLMLLWTSAGGFGEILLGYVLTVVLGGMISLSIAKVMARLTRSKQIVTISDKAANKTNRDQLFRWVHWLYLPALVSLSAVALGWDVYSADGPRASFFQPFLHLFDIFSLSAGMRPILSSRELIPALILVTCLAGLPAAMSVPYFGEFRVTGVNAGPFHTSLLVKTVGALAGVGALFALTGLFYNSLWLDSAPLPYHFGILTILGLSVHFSLGMYLGRERAQAHIKNGLVQLASGNVVVLS